MHMLMLASVLFIISGVIQIFRGELVLATLFIIIGLIWMVLAQYILLTRRK